MASDNLLRSVEALLSQVAEPLRLAATSRLELERLILQVGWNPRALSATAITRVSSHVHGLVPHMKELIDGLSDFDGWDDLEAWKKLANVGKDIYAKVKGIVENAEELPDDLQWLGELAEDLAHHLVVSWFDRYHPLAGGLLWVADVIQSDEADGLLREGAGDDTEEWLRFPGLRRRLKPSALLTLLTSPQEILCAYGLRDEHGRWLPPADRIAALAVMKRVFPRLQHLFAGVGMPTTWRVPSVALEADEPGAVLAPPVGALQVALGAWTTEDVAAALMVSLLVLSEEDQGPGILFVASGAASSEWQIGDWSVSLRGSAGFGLRWWTDTVEFISLTSAEADPNLELSLARSDDGDGGWFLGPSKGSHVRVRDVDLAARLGRNREAWDLTLSLKLSDASIQLVPEGADGFLSQVLPSSGVGGAFSVGVEYSLSQGLSFAGGIAIEVPIFASLGGVVALDSASFGLAFDEAKLTLSFAVTGGLQLGPLTVTVQNVGVEIDLHPQGVDLDARFKPPDGLGLSIDAGIVQGGGYIACKPDLGQYDGVIDLRIFDIDVQAVTLIDTKLPDAPGTWSFFSLVIASGLGIPLGFGFSLERLGGVIGIHRAVEVEALQPLFWSGRLIDLFFPEGDVVAEAPRILADFRTLFPARRGRYVFGLLGAFGWGSPKPVLTASIGLLLELPAPVRAALLGRMDLYLPCEEAALAEVHLDVLGVLDLGAKTFALDGRLRDSRLLCFDLSGDMALRVGWGEAPDFALSIGGFHPAFQRPPGFPELQRLSLSVGLGSIGRLTLLSYLAVTANTFQLGARAEAWLDLAVARVEGWLYFDALLQFEPFHFEVDFGAGVRIRALGATFSLSMSGHVSGPNPWHVRGRVRVSLWLASLTVKVNLTFGETRTEQLPEMPVLLDLLEAATLAPASWSARAPQRMGVRLSEEAQGLLDPQGTLVFRQTVLPLARPIARLGTRRLDTPTTLDLDKVYVGGLAFEDRKAVSAPFAPAQFEELDDGRKLSGPAFVSWEAGLALGDDEWDVPEGLEVALSFEEVPPLTDAPSSRSLLQAFTRLGAVARRKAAA